MSGNHLLQDGTGKNEEHTLTFTHKEKRMICVGSRKCEDERKLSYCVCFCFKLVLCSLKNNSSPCRKGKHNLFPEGPTEWAVITK